MHASIRVDLASPAFKANPYPLYARLRDEAPVFRTSLGWRRTAWLVARYDDVDALLRDARFAKDPLNAREPGRGTAGPWVPGFLRPLTRNMLDLDAPDHSWLRALVQKAFTPRLVERLRPRIQALVDELLDRALQNGRAELIRDLALPLPLTVIAELLGVPAADQPRFHRCVRPHPLRLAGFGALRLLPAVRSLLGYLRGLFVERRTIPQDDLITALVQAEEAGDRLSEDELPGMVFLLLAAGHETTANLIGTGVLTLLQHPGERERLLRDPSLVRRGDMVLDLIGSANRDPSRFPAPNTLDLARESNRHLGFGLGAHYCVGAPARAARNPGGPPFTADVRAQSATRCPAGRAAVAQAHISAGAAGTPTRLVDKSASTASRTLGVGRGRSVFALPDPLSGAINPPATRSPVCDLTYRFTRRHRFFPRLTSGIVLCQAG